MPKMKKTNLIIASWMLKLTILFALGTSNSVSQAAPRPQLPPKKATPDPYFNPKLQPLKDSVQPTAEKENPLGLDMKPLADSSNWVAPTPKSQNPTATVEDNWEIPRTASLPIVRSGSPVKNNSIIRESKINPAAGAPFVQSLQDNSMHRNATIEMPLVTAEPISDPSSPNTISNRAGITPNNGGDFSADLSNLKKPKSAATGTRGFNPAIEPADKWPASKGGPAPALNGSFPTAEKRNETNQASLSAPKTEKKPPLPKEVEPADSKHPDSKPFESTQLVAMVGNEPIFVGDMLFEVNQLIEKFMPTAAQSVKNEEIKKLIPKLVPKFVDAKLLYIGTLQKLPAEADVSKILEQAGKEFDENAMGKMMKSAGLVSPVEFDGQLRAQGSSLRKLRLSWSQDQLTKYFLSQQLSVDTEVTHQAMLDDYQKRITEYAVPARARWEQVMIRFDRTESKAEAEKQLVEMLDQIVHGANLAAMAKKGSHGFDASTGGQHDWTTKGALVLTELDQAIFSLPIGKLSGKIETADGFHVVRVLERTEATHKPFLEAQVEIKERMLDEKRNAAFEKHLKKLRQEIQVEYFLGNGPTHPSS